MIFSGRFFSPRYLACDKWQQQHQQQRPSPGKDETNTSGYAHASRSPSVMRAHPVQRSAPSYADKSLVFLPLRCVVFFSPYCLALLCSLFALEISGGVPWLRAERGRSAVAGMFCSCSTKTAWRGANAGVGQVGHGSSPSAVVYFRSSRVISDKCIAQWRNTCFARHRAAGRRNGGHEKERAVTEGG